MKLRLLRTLLLPVLFLAIGSAASAGEWHVARMSGGGWVVGQTGGSVRMSAGMPVSAGSTVVTDAQSRAMLVKDGDTMMIGPGTTLAIPYKADKGMATTVLQQTGQLSVAVQKRGRPHFSVQTPFLAAIVKGTVFTVTVAGDGAELQVQEGRVSVADLASGDRADVGAGQAASVAPGFGLGLEVAGLGALPEVRAGRPAQPLVAPAPGFGKIGKPGKAATSRGRGKDSGGAGKSRGKSAEAKGRGNGNGHGRGDGVGGGRGSGGGNGKGGGNGGGNGKGGGNGGGKGGGNGGDNGGGNGGGKGGGRK